MEVAISQSAFHAAATSCGNSTVTRWQKECPCLTGLLVWLQVKKRLQHLRALAEEETQEREPHVHVDTAGATQCRPPSPPHMHCVQAL
jgi:hypothetical protein